MQFNPSLKFSTYYMHLYPYLYQEDQWVKSIIISIQTVWLSHREILKLLDIVPRKCICVFLGEMKDSLPIIAYKAFPLYSKKKKKNFSEEMVIKNSCEIKVFFNNFKKHVYSQKKIYSFSSGFWFLPIFCWSNIFGLFLIIQEQKAILHWRNFVKLMLFLCLCYFKTSNTAHV